MSDAWVTNLANLVLLAVFVAYAAGVIRLIIFVTRRMASRIPKRLLGATLASVFFSVSILGGHGILPVPALFVVVWCSIGDCSSMYGEGGLLYMGLLPMAVQALAFTACVLVVGPVVDWVRGK
jgi:predicted permease